MYKRNKYIYISTLYTYVYIYICKSPKKGQLYRNAARLRLQFRFQGHILHTQNAAAP